MVRAKQPSPDGLTYLHLAHEEAICNHPQISLSLLGLRMRMGISFLRMMSLQDYTQSCYKPLESSEIAHKRTVVFPPA